MITYRKESPSGPTERERTDAPAFPRAPWLTHRRLIFFIIGWLVAFSLGSVFVSNPFASETSASAVPDYWRVMYLHGLLIGMVGLLALLVCAVLELRSSHTRVWIAAGVVVATLTTAIGGIFDRRVPGAEVAMWTQIIGFFALDEILVVLLVGMWAEWRRGSSVARTLPFAAGAAGTISMLAAALMGHLAGWMLEFGNPPGIIGEWAKARGVSFGDFTANLIGSHSHEMVVGVMAVAVAIAVWQFGYALLTGAARTAARVGMAMVAAGALVMTVMYVAMGFTAWAPPTLFQSAGGTNGIAGDDIVTGVLVMAGGLLAMLAVVAPNLRRPARLAAVWSWVVSFGIVVATGYYIEMHETFFGAGDRAPGAAKDAVFTWLHQDVALFLLPAVVLVMLVVDLFVTQRAARRALGWISLVASTILFAGAMVYTFVDPALHGPGYALSTIGLLATGAVLLGTIWWGTLGQQRTGPN